jgi:hypothetical protein
MPVVPWQIVSALRLKLFSNPISLAIVMFIVIVRAALVHVPLLATTETVPPTVPEVAKMELVP